MRKNFEENNYHQSKGGQCWEKGSKLSKKKGKEQEDHKSNQEENQKIKFVPKVKDRNPMQALSQLSQKGQQSEEKLNTEIKQLIKGFHVENYSYPDFFAQAIQLMDISQHSNSDIIEFTLAQTRQRELFKDQPKQTISKVVQALLNSMECNKQYGNHEACIKVLGQICFEVHDFDPQSIKKLYKSVSVMAFTQPQYVPDQKAQSQMQIGGSGSSAIVSSQAVNQKIQRLAINCVANLLMKQSSFIKESNDMIFMQLKGALEYQMIKVRNSFKSKKFISTLTTILRALSFCMGEGQKLKLNDNDAVKMFLHFYKLLFLGTPFSEKMLQISLQEAKKQNSSSKYSEEELKGDSGSFIIDTSDLSSSDAGTIGNSYGNQSPSSNDSLQQPDPYHKLKLHSIQCLQYLFVNNNKGLFNYWYLMFPSFMMKPQSDMSQFLYVFKDKQSQYFAKAESEMQREPSLFYLLEQKDNNLKFKQGLCQLLRSLLENSHVQKWQMALEKVDEQQIQSFISMQSTLGQFLRYLHYNLICLLSKYSTIPNQQQKDFDHQILIQVVKMSSTLIHITPYSKMLPGLCSHIVTSLISQFRNPSHASPQMISSNLNALSIAFNLVDVKEELTCFLQNQNNEAPNILNIIMGEHLDQSIRYSADALQFVQRVAKQYPNQLTNFWDSHFLKYLERLAHQPDKKKYQSMLKILEEWLLNFKSKLGGQQDDKEDEDEGEGFQIASPKKQGQQEEMKKEEDKKEEEHQQHTPFQLQTFQAFFRQAVESTFFQDQNFHHKKGNDWRDQNVPQETSFKGDSDMKIAALSILQNLESEQWLQLYSQGQPSQIKEQGSPIKRIINKILEISGPPAILKAASLKFFGYIVQQDLFKNDNELIQRLFTLSFESSIEGNSNIQIRNSWLLANLCYIMISDTNRVKFSQDNYMLQEILRVSINYSFNNKEKVMANSLRTLGYVLGSLDYQNFQEVGLKSINQSHLYLSKLNQNIFKGSQELKIYHLFSLIIDNLNNKNPKISWNACVALGKILMNPSVASLPEMQYLGSAQIFVTLLEIAAHKQNFKARIHAIQTLLKFEHSPDEEGLIKRMWECMAILLQELNQQYYTANAAEQKYILQLEYYALNLWAHICNKFMQDKGNQCLAAFVNEQAVILLQDICQFLRKQLMVPLHAVLLNDKQALEEETAQIFKDNPELEEKLSYLQIVVTKIRDLIKCSVEENGSHFVQVSFSVFDGFDQLAKNPVKKFRGLEVLKTKKSSFEPLFDDKK